MKKNLNWLYEAGDKTKAEETEIKPEEHKIKPEEYKIKPEECRNDAEEPNFLSEETQMTRILARLISFNPNRY